MSEIRFVRDYVQLVFEDSTLTAITLPRIRVGNTVYSKGVAGYHDSLCERIGKIVARAEVIDGLQITIAFNDGSLIEISLLPEDYRAAEAARFDSADIWASW